MSQREYNAEEPNIPTIQIIRVEKLSIAISEDDMEEFKRLVKMIWEDCKDADQGYA